MEVHFFTFCGMRSFLWWIAAALRMYVSVARSIFRSHGGCHLHSLLSSPAANRYDDAKSCIISGHFSGRRRKNSHEHSAYQTKPALKHAILNKNRNNNAMYSSRRRPNGRLFLSQGPYHISITIVHKHAGMKINYCELCLELVGYY